jgi:hypothetical protein
MSFDDDGSFWARENYKAGYKEGLEESAKEIALLKAKIAGLEVALQVKHVEESVEYQRERATKYCSESNALQLKLGEAERVINEYAKEDSEHWGIAGSYEEREYKILWHGKGSGSDLAREYQQKRTGSQISQ